MDKKNTMLLTVIAVATLLVAVVGATFAYFTATNNATGTTNVSTTTETVGAVTVTNPTAGLHLNLTADQMAEQSKNTSYYATVNADNKFSATKEDAVISKLAISGGETNTQYEMSFTVNTVKSSTVQAGDAAVVFTLADGVTMTNGATTVTSGTEIDYASLLEEYTVKYTATGDTTGIDLVKVAVKFNNTETAQNYLAGTTLTTSFTNDDMHVTVK